MSMLFLLELTRSKQLKSFTASIGNSVWRSPAGVFKLESMTGKGGAGTPGTPGSPGQNGYTITTHTSYRRRDGRPDDVVIGEPSTPIPGPVPADFCFGEDIPLSQSVVYSYMYRCQYYDYVYIPGSGTYPTRGASTRFGTLQTFEGGLGGPASTAVRNNIAIQPNTNYNLSVAAGGSLTFTWLE